MTDWKARSFDVSLTFLDGKKYKLEILKDGVNVERRANDYQIIQQEINKGDTLKVDMARGGGFTAILTPINE